MIKFVLSLSVCLLICVNKSYAGYPAYGSEEACQSYIKDRYTVVKTDEYGRKTEQIVQDSWFSLIGAYPDGQKFNGRPYLLLNTGLTLNGALDFYQMFCVIKKSTWGESNEILGIEIE